MKTIKYDPETKTLRLEGGTEEDPITYEEIEQIRPGFMNEEGRFVDNLKIRDACLAISR